MSGPQIRHLLSTRQLWSQIKEVADRYYQGQVKPMERALGLSESAILSLKLGRHKPSFAALFALSRKLNTTPVKLLTQGVAESFSPPANPKRLARVYPRKLTQDQHDGLKCALDEIIGKGSSELPMRDIAANLGYRHSYLMYWYRDECREVSKLHRMWIAKRAQDQADADRVRATLIVRQMYDGNVHVTRKMIDSALNRVGLLLRSPIVRAAAYAVRTDLCRFKRRERWSAGEIGRIGTCKLTMGICMRQAISMVVLMLAALDHAAGAPASVFTRSCSRSAPVPTLTIAVIAA